MKSEGGKRSWADGRWDLGRSWALPGRRAVGWGKRGDQKQPRVFDEMLFDF